MKSKSGSKQISQNPQSGRKGKNKNGAKSKQNNANDKNKASGATVPTDDFSWEAAGSNGLVTNAVPKSVICENKEGSIDNSRSVSNQMYQQMNSYPPYYTPANMMNYHQFGPINQLSRRSSEEKLNKKGSKFLGSLPNIVAQMRRFSLGKGSDKDLSSNKQKRNSISHSSSNDQFNQLLSNKLMSQTSHSYSSNDVSQNRSAFKPISNINPAQEQNMNRSENYFRPIVSAEQAREVYYEGQAVPIRSRAGPNLVYRDASKRYSWAVGDRNIEALRYESDQFRRSFLAHSPIKEDSEFEQQVVNVNSTKNFQDVDSNGVKPGNSYAINNIVQYNTQYVSNAHYPVSNTATNNPFYEGPIVPPRSTKAENCDRHRQQNDLNWFSSQEQHRRNSVQIIQGHTEHDIEVKSHDELEYDDLDTDCNELYAMVSTMENGVSPILEQGAGQIVSGLKSDSWSSNQSVPDPKATPSRGLANVGGIDPRSNRGWNNTYFKSEQGNGDVKHGQVPSIVTVNGEDRFTREVNRGQGDGRDEWSEERAVLVKLYEQKIAIADQKYREMESQFSHVYRQNQANVSSHQAVSEELSRRETELKAAQNTIRNLSNILGSKDSQMQGMRDQISYLNRELNQKCSMVAQLQQKVQQLQGSADFYKGQITQLQEGATASESEKLKLTDELRQSRGFIQSLQVQLQQTQQLLHHKSTINVTPQTRSENWEKEIQPHRKCNIAQCDHCNSHAEQRESTSDHASQLPTHKVMSSRQHATSQGVNKNNNNCDLHVKNVIQNGENSSAIAPHRRAVTGKSNNHEVNNNNNYSGGSTNNGAVQNLSDKIVQLEKNLAKLEQDRQHQANVYERERVCWLEEKEIVLRYQKQLQANYTHVDNVNKLLQKQIEKQSTNHF